MFIYILCLRRTKIYRNYNSGSEIGMQPKNIWSYSGAALKKNNKINE